MRAAHELKTYLQTRWLPSWSLKPDRMVLWSPVCMMIGISIYFSLESEPPTYIGYVAVASTALLLALSWRRLVRWVMLPCFLVALGFAVSQWRTHSMITPLLTEELFNRVVEGTVDEVEPGENKQKIILKQPIVEGLDRAQTPNRIRVSFRKIEQSIQAGDHIRFTAALYPLPEPAMPGGYDFARHFYFRGIGATGFAFQAPEIITQTQADKGLQSWLRNLRHTIGEDMRAHMKENIGAVAAAMTVGETGPIGEEVNTALRDSGLAHILSISGLHLAIAAGCVFFSVRFLLTLWPRYALRLPVKKIAAILGVISSFIYLALAGFPIPAQRAFIMVAFVFTAVLLDRKGITLRTLSIAAFLLLMCFPESMFNPSFQMSFAATLAIVSLYEKSDGIMRKQNWWRRCLKNTMAIVMTSLAATSATAPFVLYHFNRFALFGLLANMLVIPLATFIIMPAMVLALLLFPFGLQALPYAILEWGTDRMVEAAKAISSLPAASLALPSLSDEGIVLASAGLIWICLIAGRARWMGLIALALGLATIGQHIPADMFISKDARQVLIRLKDGSYTALRGTDRSFKVGQWLRSEAQYKLVPLKEAGGQCDTVQCSYTSDTRSIILLKKPMDEDAMQAACAEQADILIAWWYLHKERCIGPRYLIGKEELERYGAHIIRFQNEDIDVYAARKIQNRPWLPQYGKNKTSDEEENGFLIE